MRPLKGHSFQKRNAADPQDGAVFLQFRTWSVSNLTPVVFPKSGSSGSNQNADYMEEEELFKDIQRVGIV